MDKERKGKYPADLFWIGFANCLVIELWKIFLPAVILMIIGIWNLFALYVGSAFMLIDIVITTVKQLSLRNAALHSTDPKMKKWQEAILSKNWRENIKKLPFDEIEKANRKAEVKFNEKNKK